MNATISMLTLLAQSESTGNMDEMSLPVILAAVAIVVSGFAGLLIGFFLGSNYGRVSGELRILKSIKTDRVRKTRSRGEFEQEIAS